MRNADANVIKIKHEVLEEVARLAFDGELEEHKDDIAMKLIPGPLPQFRCCIYKEREIIRQRVRLAEGKAPGIKNDGNVIQVISSACEDCPISSYVVTENCQNCLGKACINACKFGAIEAGRDRSHIDASKCKECGKCVHSCPFGAIGYKSSIVNVIKAIKSGKKVYAMLAPATEGQFGVDITMESWKKAMKEVGFTDFIEVGLGGDLTAKYEAEEWVEAYKDGRKKVTSCCPGFVNLVRKHYPELSDMISTTVSPMCAVSRLVKAKEPDAVTVFIGPCLAKKSEIADQRIEGNADYALTYSEIRAIMRAKDVALEPADNTYQESSVFGKRFGNSGGVSDAVMQSMKEAGEELDIKVYKANGAVECKKSLLLMKVGRLPEDFIEGMACEGGCVGGPSAFKDQMLAKKSRDSLIKEADARGICENLKNYDETSFSMHRE